jgi:3'-phosphoadenosine 5'-phosphosulfate sulfotransferase (PAPS reductase)/FAD synthetase
MKKRVSFSGGKDSTAMLHLMIDKGIDFDEVVFFDTGWEFPEMYDHISLVQKQTGIDIKFLHPKKPFTAQLKDIKVNRREGGYSYGYGWPSSFRRWCTGRKISTMEAYDKDTELVFIGFAYDEPGRIKGENGKKYTERYPLVECGITEKDALKMCYDLGYDWGGLYNYFNRVSCFCCPLQPLASLRVLRREFPHLWDTMMGWDREILEKNTVQRKFRGDDVLADIEKRFAEEEYADSLQNKFCF